MEANVRWLVDTLVLISFLAHMLLGCCWHHAHDCRGGWPAAECSESPAKAACPCAHHDEEPGDRSHEDQPSNGACHDGSCVFVRASASLAWLPACTDALVGADVLPIDPARVAIDATDSRLRHAATPVPLHLLNQAILL